jgi:hypothetical protein
MRTTRRKTRKSTEPSTLAEQSASVDSKEVRRQAKFVRITQAISLAGGNWKQEPVGWMSCGGKLMSPFSPATSKPNDNKFF